MFETMQAEDLDILFYLPLSQEALDELIDLQAQLLSTPYDHNSIDAWKLIWGNRYTLRKCYAHVFGNMQAHPLFKIIWKSRCTPRVKFFAWLVFVDRLNTKDMLRRRHLNIQR